MNRKYLDDIGVTDRPDTWNKDDPRKKDWEKERNTYGFDERELWSLELSFHMWLYERLMWFSEFAPIDLEYHKIRYNGTEYTQKQMIDMMIERLKFSLSIEYNELDVEQHKYVREIEYMWTKIIGYMWW